MNFFLKINVKQESDEDEKFLDEPSFDENFDDNFDENLSYDAEQYEDGNLVKNEDSNYSLPKNIPRARIQSQFENGYLANLLEKYRIFKMPKGPGKKLNFTIFYVIKCLS